MAAFNEWHAACPPCASCGAPPNQGGARGWQWPGDFWGHGLDHALHQMIAIATPDVRTEVFAFLMERLAQRDVIPRLSGAALHRAIASRSKEVAGFLLELDSTDPNEESIGLTPLMHAVALGDTEITKLLLRKTEARQNARARESLFWLEKKCVPLCLPESAAHHTAGLAQARGVDVDKGDPDPRLGWSPMHLAVAMKHAACLALLLSANANPSPPSDSGRTPLHIAAQAGDVSSASLLLTRKADPSPSNNNQRTPLHLASMHGHVGAVSLLLASGAAPAPRDRGGQTALQYAVAHGRGECAMVLACAGGAATLTGEEKGRMKREASALPSPWKEGVAEALGLPKRARAESEEAMGAKKRG